MSNIAVRVTNVRNGAGYAKAFFTTLVGIEEGGKFQAAISIRDCELRESQQGEQYTRFPQKKRMKNGVAVKENGKDVYDSVVDAASEKKPAGDGYVSTKLGRIVKDEATKQVIAALENLTESGGRGAATATRAPQARSTAGSRAGTVATTGDASSNDGDTDLPF